MFENESSSILNSGVTSAEYKPAANGEIIYAPDGHKHKYYVDENGNGVAYKAKHPDNPNIFHQHQIVNWVVVDAQSNCFPYCKKKHGVSGLGPHTHLLEEQITPIIAEPDPLKQTSATHVIESKNFGTGAALYKLPTDTTRAIMGMLDNGTEVQVVREWVNKAFSEIKMVSEGKQGQYAAFQKPGIRDRFFYIKNQHLVPYENVKARLLKKIYVKPEKMSDLERVAVPNWVKNGNVPFYHKADAEYWVTAKLPYTCTGEVDMEILKKEALLKANEQLFRYYNVYYDEKIIQDFTNGFLSSFVHDYHLESRPGSKLKMLVKVRAIYFDWIRRNSPKLHSTKVEDLPLAAKKIVLNLKRYESELEKMSKLMAKLHLDMIHEGVAVPGVNLMREAQRLQKFGPHLQKLLMANGIDPNAADQADYEIEIGYSDSMKPIYVVARNVK